MLIEYELQHIKIILTAFNLLSTTFVSRKLDKIHLYWQAHARTDLINLSTDIAFYLHNILARKAIPTANRKIAFICGQNSNRKVVIIEYKQFNFAYTQQLIIRHNWIARNATPIEIEQDIQFLSINNFYNEINVYTLSEHNNFILNHPILENMPRHNVNVSENSGISLTEVILMLMFTDTIQPIDMEQAQQRHNQRCIAHLQARIEQLAPSTRKTLLDLYIILIKYTALEEKLQTTDIKYFMQQYQADKQTLFSVNFPNTEAVLQHLPFSGILHSLTFASSEELMQALQAQYQIQRDDIVTLELERRTQASKLATQQTWSSWFYEKSTNAISSCYQRSTMGICSDFIAWITQTITPKSTVTSINSMLGHITPTLEQAISYLPEKYRPSMNNVLREDKLFDSCARCVGATIGVGILYYTSLFDIVFSMSLLVLTEFAYNHLQSQQTYIEQASNQFYYSIRPSLSVMLRINLLLIALITSLLTRDTTHVKHSLITLGVSEILRQAFLKLSQPLELNQHEKHYLDYAIVQLGLVFGEFIYHRISDRQLLRMRIETTIKNYAHTADLPANTTITFQDLYAPWHWFSNTENFKLYWSDIDFHYHADCVVEQPSAGANCTLIETRPIPLKIT